MDWPHLLAYITGRVDQELLLRNEYLAAENRILRAKIKGRLQLSDREKSTLAEIAHRLGHKALAENRDGSQQIDRNYDYRYSQLQTQVPFTPKAYSLWDLDQQQGDLSLR